MFEIAQHGSFEVRLMRIYDAIDLDEAADFSISCLQLSANATALEATLPHPDRLGAAADKPFTPAEKAQIRKALSDFRDRIRDIYKPDAEQSEEIEEELHNLSQMLDALQRRVDWKGIVISTLVNIATTLALSGDGLGRLGALFVAALRVPLGLP